MGLIYCATNQTNEKKYIGLTIHNLAKRKSAHYSDARNHHDDSYFHRALNKYGETGFEWEIIDENEDLEVLKQLERLHIARYESMNRNIGYNTTMGGDGNYGLRHSEEAKRRIGEASKGRKHTEETRKRISESITGKNNPTYSTRRPLNVKIACSQKQHGNGLFGFTGITYKNKHIEPQYRVWNSKITYNKHRTSLGMYNDPLSAELVYKLVWGELHSGEVLT